MSYLSFVIPLYNEEKNIKEVYQRVLQLVERLKDDYEIIFVNDGSKDRTLSLVKELSEEDSNVRYISLSRNFGHQAALGAGLAHAAGDAIISMDADLQDPPEVVEEMVMKWRSGTRIVYARRKNFRKDHFVKRYATRAYYRLLDRFSDIRIPRNVGDFRLVDRKVQDVLNNLSEKRPYWRGLVAWTGYEHDFVDYQRPDREEGDSGYTLRKLIQLGMDGIMGFSFLPLRIGFVLGIISMILGFGFLTYIAYDGLINDVKYQGYKILVVVNFIFVGFLFILIWLIGEYIGRVLNQVRNKPLFVIDEKGNFKAEETN